MAASKKKKTEKPENPETYSTDRCFEVGEWIYHPLFKDTGKITAKKPFSGDMKKIIVKFEEVGKKELISCARKEFQ